MCFENAARLYVTSLLREEILRDSSILNIPFVIGSKVSQSSRAVYSRDLSLLLYKIKSSFHSFSPEKNVALPAKATGEKEIFSDVH